MTIKVCIGSACHLKGSYSVINSLQDLVAKHGLSDKVTVRAVFCLGNCVNAVSVQIDEGEIYSVSTENVEQFFNETVLGQTAETKKKYEILKKRELTPEITLMEIYAPLIAKKAQAGQFIILRTTEKGERIPLTVAGTDAQTGAVTIIFQKVGATTMELGEMNEKDALQDFVGPLGTPTHIEGIENAAVVGGGLGCAIAYPIAKALHEKGAKVDMIAGFRTKDIIILEEEMKAASTSLYLCTDDGSYGFSGFVTDQLKELIESGKTYDTVFAIGPLPMMKFVCQLTKKYGIKTVVSMNPIMVDGTGMCGGCRVTVGGEIKFACVDGPDFDGHLVDFDEAIERNAAYKDFEKRKVSEHKCRLTGEVRHG